MGRQHRDAKSADYARCRCLSVALILRRSGGVRVNRCVWMSGAGATVVCAILCSC